MSAELAAWYPAARLTHSPLGALRWFGL